MTRKYSSLRRSLIGWVQFSILYVFRLVQLLSKWKPSIFHSLWTKRVQVHSQVKRLWMRLGEENNTHIIKLTLKRCSWWFSWIKEKSIQAVTSCKNILYLARVNIYPFLCGQNKIHSQRSNVFQIQTKIISIFCLFWYRWYSKQSFWRYPINYEINNITLKLLPHFENVLHTKKGVQIKIWVKQTGALFGKCILYAMFLYLILYPPD